MAIENTGSTVYFNRESCGNGLFVTINTSEWQTVPSILAQFLNCREFEPSLQRFLANIKGIMADGGFIDDYLTIAMEAPELSEQTIHKAFIHVGESVAQNNIVSALLKVLEMNTVLYHTNACAEDSHSIYIFLKQQASTVRNEKTHSETVMGEKPKLAEYLVMLQVSVNPTTIELHGHTLGAVGHGIRSY